MARIVLLDAGVNGLAISNPALPRVDDCLLWLDRLRRSGRDILIPDVTDYEVRRELIRISARAKLDRLDRLRSRHGVAHVDETSWLQAAEFWSIVRKSGLPTADPHALDADAILAAVAATLARSGHQVTIATTNVVYLRRFPGVDARPWDVVA